MISTPAAFHKVELLTLKELTLTEESRLCGKLGDVCGKRILFLCGCVWIAATSVAISFSPSEVCLDIMRALAGLVSSIYFFYSKLVAQPEQ